MNSKKGSAKMGAKEEAPSDGPSSDPPEMRKSGSSSRHWDKLRSAVKVQAVMRGLLERQEISKIFQNVTGGRSTG